MRIYISVVLMTAQDILNRQLVRATEQPQEASVEKHLLVSFEAMSSSSSPRDLDRQDRKEEACYLRMPQEERSDRILDHRSESTKMSTSREVSARKKEANSISPAGQSLPPHTPRLHEHSLLPPWLTASLY